MTKLHLSTLWPATVGFDRFFHEVESLLNQTETASTFPPHNIIKISDNKYVVELAIAGFSKDEISIKIIDGVLEIKGEKNNQDKDVQYLHKGIGARSFTKTIRLAETVEVQGAQFKDGILSVGLENVIPEHKKPRSIEIKDDLNFYKPQFLTERN
jgi:molecular chaperone IbpA